MRSAAWPLLSRFYGDVFSNPISPLFYPDYCITYAELYKLQNQKISDGVDKVYKWGKTEMYPMPEKECSRWKQAAAQKVWGKWVSEMNSKGLAGQKVLDTYKSLCETYSGKSQYTPGFELWQQKYGKR